MQNLHDFAIERLKGMGRELAAEKYGVSIKTVSNYLARKTEPPLSIVQAMLDEQGSAIPPEQATAVDWKGRRLIVLMPSRGQIHPTTMFCVLSLFDKFHPLPDGQEADGKPKFRHRIGFDTEASSFVTHGRNILATRFLESDAEWSLWIDDDMIVPCSKPGLFMARANCGFGDPWVGMDCVSRLLTTASRTGAHIVSGLYYGRNTGGRAMFAEALGNDNANRDAHEAPREHVVETKGVATGCLLVHRRVYEGMLELPEVKAGAEYRDTAGRIARQYGFFTSTVTAQGEDMAFSARARAIGEKMVVDFGCVCGHVGDHAFWPHNTRPNGK